jgi:RNA polymerase sigma-70 factor (ECF subfamily)
MGPNYLENPRDLEKAFLKWNKFIYNYVYLRLQSREAAEDVSQEVFFSAWRSRETFNPKKSSLKNWLFVIATNQIRNYLRATIGKNTVDLEEIKEMVKDEKENISMEAERNNMIELVFEKLKKLNERDQEILILRYQQDLSMKEISAILDMEYSAAKVAIHRATKKLAALCA